MQLEAPTTNTTQTPTQLTCTDNTTTTAAPVIERPDDGGSRINENNICNSSSSSNDKVVMEEDEIGQNSDPTAPSYTQHDTTNNRTNNKGSPGTASYIAKITGYISKTINTDNSAHTNNNYNNNNTMNIQYIYVNNRPVDLPKINRLLNEIWLKYTLKSRTSISYILNLYLPTHTYDINMSPNKREIVLLYEIDIIDWMRITINRLYSETTHGVFLVSNNNNNNNNLINNDNMLNNTSNSSNKNDIHKVRTNKSSHISTITITTTDSIKTTTDPSSTIQQQPTSSTSLLISNGCPKDDNSNQHLILSSQTTNTTTQNMMDIINDNRDDNFGLISSYNSLKQGDVITTDLTHLTHIDLIHDIDKEEAYNNYEYNNGEDEDVYTSNSNMSNKDNIVYTELQPSSSASSSVVWMEESEVIIMTPPTTHTQPVDRQIDSESIVDSTAVIHPSAVASAGTYTSNTSSNSIDNNIVGEKRKHTPYNNTDENSNNTTAHKSIKLSDNSSTSSASSSSTATREIWSNYQPIDENNNTHSNSNSNTTTYSNDSNSYTNNILQSCTTNATSLLHYIHTLTTHTHTNKVSHFSTLDFWFPGTTPHTDSATHTVSLYDNNNEAYTASNTAEIATGNTDSVVADIIALFSAIPASATTPSPTAVHTDAVTATATTTNGTSLDMAHVNTDEEQGPATSEEGVTAATSAVEETLYKLKTISKEVC